MALLEVRDLVLQYRTRQGWVRALDGVSFHIDRGEALGIVGESGSGKTSLALALLQVLPDNGLILSGSILLDGTDLLSLSEPEMHRVRWRRISMVHQAAMSSLNPVLRVGDQIVETIQAHQDVGYDEASQETARLFRVVGLDPGLLSRYPHEYSGGMRQRAVIALALACRPDLVIADEPTTALDAVTQRSILTELGALREREGTAMLYISHDVGLIAEVSTRMDVMYAGRIVETASRDQLLARPHHPYTDALLRAYPKVHGPRRPPVALEGAPPDLIAPPVGCGFHPRCPNALDVCRAQAPPLQDHAPGHQAACWNPIAPPPVGGA